MKKNRPSSPSSSPLPRAGEGCSPPRPACGERDFLENAKQLRSNQTDAEQKLWHNLRARRFMDLKFKRQKPLGRYIVDFVCVERKLIIELDGGQHAEQAAYDTERDDWLRSEGYAVLRFWNNEVMLEMEGVLERIRLALESSPSPQPSPRKRGEGADLLAARRRGEGAGLLPSPACGRGVGGEGKA